jgi:hypothetical protein
MPLNIDYKVDKIIKEIQAELKKEYGKDVDYNTVVRVIEQECRSTVKAFAEGDTIVWKYFGTYVATKKRVDALNNQYIKKGKLPTLEDNGLIRLSFKRNGEAVAATEIVGHRKSDTDSQGDWIDKLKAERNGTF